mmetsp:Transcript_75603/g.143927  ORF Transcript_75603/g.143927 Transcript_75603/m.143927 type:complete len:219 (+) Transcript_75603:101-757(+)
MGKPCRSSLPTIQICSGYFSLTCFPKAGVPHSRLHVQVCGQQGQGQSTLAKIAIIRSAALCGVMVTRKMGIGLPIIQFVTETVSKSCILARQIPQQGSGCTTHQAVAYSSMWAARRSSSAIATRPGFSYQKRPKILDGRLAMNASSTQLHTSKQLGAAESMILWYSLTHAREKVTNMRSLTSGQTIPLVVMKRDISSVTPQAGVVMAASVLVIQPRFV